MAAQKFTSFDKFFDVTIQSNKIASNEGKDNQALKSSHGTNQTNFLANAMHPRAWDACGHLPSTAPGGAFTLLASMAPHYLFRRK